MTESETAGCFRDWLGSREATALLYQIARSVFRYLSIYRIHPPFWNPGHSPEPIIEEIVSELTIFLLDAAPARQAPMLGTAQCGNYLKWAFIRKCIDRCRVSGADEYRFIYRAMNRVCRQAPRFFIRKIPGRPLQFSMDENSLPIASLSEEDIREIALPGDLAADDWLNHITKKRFLLPALQYFWESVCRLWENKPVWVDLRYPAHWLMRFTAPEGFREVYFPDDGTADRLEFEIQESSPGESFGFQHRIADTATGFDPESVMQWASIFPNRLSPSEMAVFYLRHCIHQELKRIARQLQYKSASGPAYPLKKAEEKLAAFTAEFPWISADDLHMEAFSLFREKLCDDLKSRVSVP